MVPLGGLFIELGSMTFEEEALPPLEPPPLLLPLLPPPQAVTSTPPTSAAQINAAGRRDTNSPPRPDSGGELCHRGGRKAPASGRPRRAAGPSSRGRRAADRAAGRCAGLP